jgi:hypothetical protein
MVDTVIEFKVMRTTNISYLVFIDLIRDKRAARIKLFTHTVEAERVRYVKKGPSYPVNPIFISFIGDSRIVGYQ